MRETSYGVSNQRQRRGGPQPAPRRPALFSAKFFNFLFCSIFEIG